MGNTLTFARPRGPTLLVLLRGEAYRDGQRGKSSYTSRAPHVEAAQRNALRSIIQFALEPLRTRGWSTLLLADITTSRSRHAELASWLNSSSVSAQVSGWAHRVRAYPAGKTQLGSLNQSFAWALAAAANKPWRALLLLRVDLTLKAPLNLPSPPKYHAECARSSSCDLISPFRVGSRTPSGNPSPNDVILWLPRCRIAEFIAQLAVRAAVAADRTKFLAIRAVGMHDLCDWLTDAPHGRVRFMLPGVWNSDSSAEANPIYRMSGRNEGPDQSSVSLAQRYYAAENPEAVRLAGITRFRAMLRKEHARNATSVGARARAGAREAACTVVGSACCRRHPRHAACGRRLFGDDARTGTASATGSPAHALASEESDRCSARRGEVHLAAGVDVEKVARTHKKSTWNSEERKRQPVDVAVDASCECCRQ